MKLFKRGGKKGRIRGKKEEKEGKKLRKGRKGRKKTKGQKKRGIVGEKKRN